MAEKETHLSTEVNNTGVWIIEGQQHPIARVHLVDGHRLLHVFLEKQKKIYRYNQSFTKQSCLGSFWFLRRTLHVWGLEGTTRHSWNNSPYSREPAASHSFDWSRWWGCCRWRGKWPSLVERPRVPFPSPVKHKEALINNTIITSLCDSVLPDQSENISIQKCSYIFLILKIVPESNFKTFF